MIEQPLPRWEGEAASDLAARWGASAVRLYRQVGSTNDAARALGAAGAPAGTVVVAEEQLSGRGRSGRTWSSPPGLGLWFSVLLRPSGRCETATLPLRIGLGLARVLDPFTRHDAVSIKWPNDLLLRGRKLGGILCERSWQAGSGVLVVGVGINVLHRPDDFATELRDLAISLAMGSAGTPPDRLAVATAAVRAVLAVDAEGEWGEEQRRELEHRDALRGRRISVLEPRTGALLSEGTAEGISGDGALLVRDGSRVLEIRSGTVRGGSR